MFDLKISSVECTYFLRSGRVVRTIASYDIDDRMVWLGNWSDGDATLRPKDDVLRETNPEVAVLSPLFHEITHDVLHVIDENGSVGLRGFDALFFQERLQDDLGLPDWKPCVYCGSKMEFPGTSDACRRCHEEEIGWSPN